MDSMGSIMDIDGGGSKTLAYTFRPERIKNSVMSFRGDESSVLVENQIDSKIRRVRKLDTQVTLVNNSS